MPPLLHKSSPSAIHITYVVAAHYSVRVAELKGPYRSQELALARHMAMALIRHLTDKSFAEIAADFCRRDHGTVLRACRRIARDHRPTFDDLVQLLASDCPHLPYAPAAVNSVHSTPFVRPTGPRYHAIPTL